MVFVNFGGNKRCLFIILNIMRIESEYADT